MVGEIPFNYTINSYLFYKNTPNPKGKGEIKYIFVNIV
tara:strand:- start:67 stop:180 length:114 start_codon:yes stop_codon:yes gene_type:complete